MRWFWLHQWYRQDTVRRNLPKAFPPAPELHSSPVLPRNASWLHWTYSLRSSGRTDLKIPESLFSSVPDSLQQSLQ